LLLLAKTEKEIEGKSVLKNGMKNRADKFMLVLRRVEA
jgi:hypothetical protein